MSNEASVGLSADLQTLLRELQNELVGLHGRSDTSDEAATAVAQYCASMQRHSVTRLRQVAALSREDLVELGVAIGHRQWITSVATRLVAVSGDAQTDAARGNADSPLSPPASSASAEVTWLNLTGRMTSMAAYMDEMRRIRIHNGFPKTFERLFLHNQPMPFLLRGGPQADDNDIVGVLLRVPDLTDTTGTTVNTITNRVCVLVNRSSGVVITYHRCSTALLSGVEDDVRAATHGDGHVVLDCLVDAIIRRLIRLYHAALEQLQEQVDFLEMQSEDGRFVYSNIRDTHRVQRLAFLAKRATVYKRCADASRDVLLELGEIPWIAAHIPALVSGLEAVSAMAEELSSNAHVSIDVIIALSEFKSSNNLKAFTYLTVFFYPISVATSWYGMNYPMPELVAPNAYYVFAGTTLSLTTLFFCWFVGLSTDAWRWLSWCCCVVMRQRQQRSNAMGEDISGGATGLTLEEPQEQSVTAPLVDHSTSSAFSKPRLLNDERLLDSLAAKSQHAAAPVSRWQAQKLTFSDHLKQSPSASSGSFMKRSSKTATATASAGAVGFESATSNVRSPPAQPHQVTQPSYGTITP